MFDNMFDFDIDLDDLLDTTDDEQDGHTRETLKSIYLYYVRPKFDYANIF